MVQSNEFKGATLADAVRKATAAYDRTDEAKSYCEQLRNRFEAKKQEQDRILDEALDLKREIERLERQAIREKLTAIAGYLAAGASSLRALDRLFSRLRRLDLGKDKASDLSSIVTGVTSAIVGAISDLAAADTMSEVRGLKRELDRLLANFNRTADDMLDLMESFDRAHCRFQGS